jgi:hypothetical protein
MSSGRCPDRIQNLFLSLFCKKSDAKNSYKVKIGKELKMPVLFSVEKRTKKDFQ